MRPVLEDMDSLALDYYLERLRARIQRQVRKRQRGSVVAAKRLALLSAARDCAEIERAKRRVLRALGVRE